MQAADDRGRRDRTQLLLGVPDAARRSLVRSDGQLGLRLALQPITPDRPPIEPLGVTLGDPAWK